MQQFAKKYYMCCRLLNCSVSKKAKTILTAREKHEKKRDNMGKGSRISADEDLNKNKKGFTLLELLVVVGILAALVALALPFYQDYVNQSKLTAAQADLNTFAKALATYDQLEPTMFNGTTFVPLIGTYLQDFRTNTAQVNPTDPWGSDYEIRPQAGVILSYGPNGVEDSADTDRTTSTDDILVTWKPTFFITGCRAINTTTVEVSFSRKVSSVGTFSIDNGLTVGGTYKISDSIYRFTVTTAMVKGTTYTVTLTTATAQDGKVGFDATKPDGTTAGNTGSFTY
jgi:prepilin-type N-terminal cleavage/methylation domain-containing protein